MSIRLLDVSKSFSGKPVIENFSLELPEHGVVGLSGPSGCGKTTLLRLLAGLENPDGGSIEGITGLTVSMVFQEDRLLPWLTALENIALILADHAAAQVWLDKVQLADYGNHYPAELSGGMKRRLALARALAKTSDLLILDEPFTGMDDVLKQSMINLIREDAQKRPVLLVSHDRADIEALDGQVIRMSDNGMIIC